MQEASYPALHRCADQASNRKQQLYLSLIGAEYALLLVAAIFSISVFASATFYLIYAVFLALIALLLTRALLDMALHHARGAIRRGPRIQVPRSEFRNHLQSLFEENKDTAKKMAADWSAEDQITPEMDRIRALSLEERKQCYAAERIQDQRVWYTRKAATNKRSARKWVAAGIAAYAIAAALAVGRVRLPDRVWPIGPVLVLASSILGWMQVKKFSELAATYTVAAREIGLLRPKLDDVTSESELSDFVNDAELAFSREHTLWMARRTT
jgi:SMODS and SLOG-associating 2TM effector domain 1